MSFRTALAASAAALVFSLSSPACAEGAQPDRVDFSVSFQGLTSDLRIMSATVMPGESLSFETDASASAASGQLSQTDDGWIWRAPDEPGPVELTFQRGGETITINAFVLRPFRNGADTALNGYRIGQYTKQPYRGLASYAEPRGFVELSDGMADMAISPHFKLGQFICKQQPGHDPTYLLVRPAMLIKLERLLEAANEKGWTADTFFVMSGFRTPFYNAAIGNRTTSSRHLYGGAADIYIDYDRDGVMDDLDGDGAITKDDARALANLALHIASSEDSDNWPAGGIGVYGPNAVRGPFVHVDARGYAARW